MSIEAKTFYWLRPSQSRGVQRRRRRQQRRHGRRELLHVKRESNPFLRELCFDGWLNSWLVSWRQQRFSRSLLLHLLELLRIRHVSELSELSESKLLWTTGWHPARLLLQRLRLQSWLLSVQLAVLFRAERAVKWANPPALCVSVWSYPVKGANILKIPRMWFFHNFDFLCDKSNCECYYRFYVSSPTYTKCCCICRSLDFSLTT